MAITTNTLKSLDVAQDTNGAMKAFTATASDDNYLEHPSDLGKQVISKAISFDIDTDDITVEFFNGTEYTILAGSLSAGVMHSIKIIKVLDTGTGATVKVTIWV